MNEFFEQYLVTRRLAKDKLTKEDYLKLLKEIVSDCEDEEEFAKEDDESSRD